MDHFNPANYNKVLDDESMDEENEEIDIQSEDKDEGLSVDSTATIES
jgi:hypothetical protein